jgi:hypothetical protein
VAGVLLLAVGVGGVHADVGVGTFSVTHAAPGDAIQVSLQGCSSSAADVRVSLGSGGSNGSLGTLHDVPLTDTSTAGTYGMVVPHLATGTYLLGAACPKSGPFGFYGAELRITALPATSTADAPPPAAETPTALALAVVWVLGTAISSLVLRRRRA